MLDGILEFDEIPARQKTHLKMLMNVFDKNKNGKIDPEEKPALIEFLKNVPRPN